MPASAPTSDTVINTFADFAAHADYSLLHQLTVDPQATTNGDDQHAREVLSGHYIPVTPKPLPAPDYMAHSHALFNDLGLSDALVHDNGFRRWFSGDSSVATGPLRPYGWATGYALSLIHI